MKDYFINYVVISGPKKEKEEFINNVSSFRNSFDFNNIYPIPDLLMIPSSFEENLGRRYILAKAEPVIRPEDIGIVKCFEGHSKNEKAEILRLGRLALRNIIEYGYATHTEWAAANWGTEWNSIGSVRDEDQYWFKTKDAAPIGVYSKLIEEVPELKFTWIFRELGSKTKYEFIMKDGVVTTRKTKKVMPEFKVQEPTYANAIGLDMSKAVKKPFGVGMPLIPEAEFADAYLDYDELD